MCSSHSLQQNQKCENGVELKAEHILLKKRDMSKRKEACQKLVSAPQYVMHKCMDRSTVHDCYDKKVHFLTY